MDDASLVSGAGLCGRGGRQPWCWRGTRRSGHSAQMLCWTPIWVLHNLHNRSRPNAATPICSVCNHFMFRRHPLGPMPLVNQQCSTPMPLVNQQCSTPMPLVNQQCSTLMLQPPCNWLEKRKGLSCRRWLITTPRAVLAELDGGRSLCTIA